MTKQTRKLPTAKETLNILNKPWCTIDDVIALTGMGRNFAFKIKKEINEGLIKDGFNVLDSYIPTDKLIVYLNLNIEYLKKVADAISEDKNGSI